MSIRNWDAYYCNQHLTKEMSDNIFKRNLPSESLQPNLNARSVSTRFTMPITDCRNKSRVPIVKYKDYSQHNQFNPGYGAPYVGYCKNIDNESKLFNYFNPLQRAQQGVYIPSSRSDLYNHMSFVPSTQSNLAQKKEQFNQFNPNECDIAKNSLYNHTRQQTKNIGQN